LRKVANRQTIKQHQKHNLLGGSNKDVCRYSTNIYTQTHTHTHHKYILCELV